jgi:FHS family glucose/mannose:H+ symporter-like MFS transporter
VRKNLLTAVACFGIFVFGIVMALLGTILPILSERLHLSLPEVGNLFLLMNFAMLAAMPFLGPLMDRAGMKGILMVGALGAGLALVLIGNATSVGWLLGSVFLLGGAGGCLNGAANTLVADLHADPAQKNAALNLLGVFFGFGALSLPFCLGVLLQTLSMSWILYLGACLSFLLALVCCVPSYPRPKQEGRIQWSEVGGLAKKPLLLLFGFLLFFQSGNEFILGGYLSTYLNSSIGFSISTSSYLLAGYWGAIMLARLVLSRLLLVLSGSSMVLSSALAVVGSMVLLLSTSSMNIIPLAVIAVGLSISGIFPTTLGIAGSRFAENSGTAFGILFTIALTGGMVMPWVVGHLSANLGLRLGLGLVIVNAFAIAFLLMLASRRMKRSGN